MMNDDPGNSYNVIIGKVTFMLWELVDALNVSKVPYDSNKKDEVSPWYLTHFVPKEVIYILVVALPVLTLQLSRTAAIYSVFLDYIIRSEKLLSIFLC